MKRIWNALLYSLSGIMIAWKDEAAFRQEVVLSIFLIPTAFFIAPDKISLLLMIGSVLLVLLVELMNTAVEAAVNYTGINIHHLAKKAKDTASAAVLIALLNVGLVWGMILL